MAQRVSSGELAEDPKTDYSAGQRGLAHINAVLLRLLSNEFDVPPKGWDLNENPPRF